MPAVGAQPRVRSDRILAVYLLWNRKRVIHLNAEAPHCTLDLGVTEKKLITPSLRQLQSRSDGTDVPGLERWLCPISCSWGCRRRRFGSSCCTRRILRNDRESRRRCRRRNPDIAMIKRHVDRSRCSSELQGKWSRRPSVLRALRRAGGRRRSVPQGRNLPLQGWRPSTGPSGCLGKPISLLRDL